jgi:hypothetical protein
MPQVPIRLHRLFPRFKRRQLALRETLEVFVENMRQTLRADPRRSFHIRAIEHQNLLHPGRNFLVKMRSRHIGEDQQRSRRMSSYVGAYQIKQHQHLLGRAVTEIRHVDGMAPVFNEAQPLVERLAGFHTGIHFKISSTTP